MIEIPVQAMYSRSMLDCVYRVCHLGEIFFTNILSRETKNEYVQFILEISGRRKACPQTSNKAHAFYTA